jgi:hypothetical protein
MSKLEESVARELLTSSGVGVIWQAHAAAAAAHRVGNDRAAEILLNIADAAEAIWRREGSCPASLTDPSRRTPSPETDICL